MPLKRFTPGCCCDSQTGNWPCGIFNDDFDRPDSETVGNGWGGTGDFSISEERLEGFSGDLFAPLSGRTNISISTAVRFYDTTQEARIYYGGPNNYVAIRPDSSDDTRRNLYIVYGGVIRQRTFVPSGFPEGQYTPVNVCITNTQINAYAGGRKVAHAPPLPMVLDGSIGVGVRGNTGSGPVVFERFYADTVGEFCYSCSSDECVECSFNSSWLLDLSAFNGQMQDAVDPFNDIDFADCSPCGTWGTYVLDPFLQSVGRCEWRYEDEFCLGRSTVPGYDCGQIILSISMTALYPSFVDQNAAPCSSRLTIALRDEGNTPDSVCLYRQSVQYTAGGGATDTNGLGLIPFQKNWDGLTAGAFESAEVGASLACAKNVTNDGGILTYELYFPPDVIFATRL